MSARAWRDWLPWGALLLVAAVLGAFNGLGRVESAALDGLAALHQRAPDPRIVIVAIDDQSLQWLGRWPWRRDVHAELLERLRAARPAAIGIDLILADPDEQYPQDDLRLAAAIRRAGNVVLPLYVEGGEHQPLRPVLPLPLFADSAWAVGHIDAELDPDGVVRSVFLREGQPPHWWDHFALALYKATGRELPDTRLPGLRRPDTPCCAGGARWARDYWTQLAFVGEADSYPRISYADVLRGRVPASALAGRIVLVGATAPGLGDSYSTPLASQNALMPGVEVIANVLDGLLDGIELRNALPWENALFTVMPSLLALWLLRRSRRVAPLVVLLLAGTLTVAWGALHWGGIRFAPLAALGCLALVYPLWSWQRLRAAMRYLADEVDRLERQPGMLPAPTPATAGGDGLQRHIAASSQALEALRHLHRLVHDTIDGLADPVCVVDEHGVILLANAAAGAFFGRDGGADGLVAQRAWPLLAEQLAAPDGALLPGLPEIEHDHGGELRAGRAGGCDILLKCVPRHGAGQRPAGWILVLIDLTTVQQAQRQRDEALDFLSHDMRSPQASILTLIDLHQPQDEHERALLQRIATQARRTLNLADDFIRLARARSEQLHRETIDLNDIAIEAVDQLWDHAQARGCVIEADVPDTPSLCLGDPLVLARAVANLLDNALKYGPDQGEVRCALSAVEGAWRIAVRDQGAGIAPQARDAMLQRFQRSAGHPRDDAGGFGLGLAFVQTVAQRHGGRLAMSGTPHGFEVAILLPMR
ncbi:CHASE2 domain-containing protein [Chitiniphilus eburneus]|uniref:histidine kinase n=1 Tax=Chitiniphilus eburneus TaxID=2571148 RepID=A0A4U0PQS7_9NEIS|nr:CHASE2 domain-containing protein [Chitiniphilus eburneus]TJZ65364.1 CHASE2 domain-containing protein [Chitiniphilus eburneus]